LLGLGALLASLALAGAFADGSALGRPRAGRVGGLARAGPVRSRTADRLAPAL